MRIGASAASRLGKNLGLEVASIKGPRVLHGLRRPVRNDGARYPVGQSDPWGGPPMVSHGFAPAIGDDAYLGGTGS